MRRVLLPHLALSALDTIPVDIDLAKDAAHYLLRVLRQSPGESIEICDGKGARWHAHIHADATLERCRVGLIEPLPPIPTPFPVYLAQGIPKGDRFEQILRQGTEVGIAAFYPLSTERTVVQLDEKKAGTRRERWEKITAEAARQSQRSFAPTVHDVAELGGLVSALPVGVPVIVCWEGEQERGLRAWVRSFVSPPCGVVVLIGPEGGFSAKEVAFLADRGILSVGLGPLILRTETAGVAVASILQYEWGVMAGVGTRELL